MESIKLGKTSCDYLSVDDWINLCAQWIDKGDYHHVVTLNPEMIMLAERDERFRKVLSTAQVRVPDGAGLIWARWYLRSRYWPWIPSLIAFLWQSVERVTGVDAVEALAKLCWKKEETIFFLGGDSKTTTELANALMKKYDGLTVATSPDHSFDAFGPNHILEDINKRKPAVLLAAYGAPKQTIWLENQRDKLPSVRVSVGVGGAFDILSENLPRAPKILRAINMEWLWRLYLEPARGPRIWQAVVKFPLLIREQKNNNLKRIQNHF
jgi:N-acetylglucosaminyldiphosphoundecaprenol N-acetyl-beta-D-mannosaminyltransferase